MGHKTEVMYGMHHWPVWGTERVLEMLRKGRDAYRYINDQTLRLANHGHTPVEIAEMVELPDALARHWALRGYYGTVNHNVKATYVKYLGWFDGNPANLHTLPPEEVAKRYVEFMGGAEATLEKARSAYERGEYRWVAEVVNHVVFADPTNQEARGCRPTPWSRWATSRSRVPGATSISRAPKSCARAWSSSRRPARPARIASGP